MTIIMNHLGIIVSRFRSRDDIEFEFLSERVEYQFYGTYLYDEEVGIIFHLPTVHLTITIRVSSTARVHHYEFRMTR